MYCYIFWLCSS